MIAASLEATYALKSAGLLRTNFGGTGATLFRDLPRPDGFAVNLLDTLLATYDARALTIWAIGEDKESARRLFEHRLDSRVRQLAFHPSGRFLGAVVALTEERLVAVYCPHGVRPVVEEMRLRGGGEAVPVNITRFCFGSPDAPMGAFALYLADADNDIYRIAPFAPPEIEMSYANLADCDARLPRSWVDAGKSWRRDLGVTRVYRRRADAQSASGLPLVLDQESIKIVPFPAVLYGEDLVDIQSGELGWKRDFVVALTSQYINFLVSPSAESDSLTLVLSLKLKTASARRTIALVSRSHLFINDDDAARTVLFDISALRLAAYMQQESFGEVRRSELPLADVFATPYEVVARERESGVRHSFEDGSAAGLTLTERLAACTIDDELVELLVSDSVIDTSELKVRLPRPAEPLGPNLQSLMDLQSLGAHVEDWYVSFLKARASLETNQKLLRQVDDAQSEVYRELRSRIERLQRGGPDAGKVAAVLSRQAELNKRAFRLQHTVATLHHSQNRPLSIAERAWFSEVRELPAGIAALQKELEDSRQLAHAAYPRADNARFTPQQLQYILRRLKSQDILITLLKERYQFYFPETVG